MEKPGMARVSIESFVNGNAKQAQIARKSIFDHTARFRRAVWHLSLNHPATGPNNTANNMQRVELVLRDTHRRIGWISAQDGNATIKLSL